jgi:hypothetical protein
MDLPATEAAGPLDPPANAPTEWLIDAGDPVLTDERMVWIADPARPDRLAWNTFRTLALWEPDAWVPSLLEVACGAGNRLSALEWSGASVLPWAAKLDLPSVCDVVLEGPEAAVVLACTLSTDPGPEELRAAALAALDDSLHGGREAGLVVVAPPEAEGVAARLELATEIELHEGRRARDLLADAMGWITWPELGRLALDLAEENDQGPAEQVRRLVTQMQDRFRDATW